MSSWRSAPLVLAALFLPPDVGVAGEITREDIGPLPPAQIVIVGEIHDNPIHHRSQAKIIERIAPSAVVFEMLDPAQADAANIEEPRESLAVRLDWADSGWPDWSIYAPVFAAVGEAKIFGAALAPDLVRAAITDGAAVSFGPEAARYSLDQPLDPREQAEREEAQFEAHCGALPESALSGMVEAQRLRDAGFARTALEALDETGGPVVVIVGSGHARTDRGIAAAIARAAPAVTTLSIGQLEAVPQPPAPFDFWLVAPAPQREDPCAGFADTPGGGG